MSLAVRHVSKAFGGFRALDDVSLRVPNGSLVCVVGPNGSGKSTLLRIASGLLRANRGQSTLTVAGKPVTPAERRRWVGYATPELAFYEELTAVENLTFVAEARGMASPAKAAREALARVGLEARGADRVGELSSGMKQRLRLAFALLDRPPVLLLDEPGGHLDDEGRTMLARLVDETRRTTLVLIATNDEREWRIAEQRIELRGRGLGHPA